MLRRLALVVAVAACAAVPATARAELLFDLPAQIFLEIDESGATKADPGRCYVAVFVEFPIIAHAKGYEIVVKRTDQKGKRTQYTAPPFETAGFTKRYPPPKGFGRFFQLGYGSGKGCAETIAGVEGKAVIVSAKVSLDKPFEKRFRAIDEPPYKCVTPTGERHVNLGVAGDGRVIVVRKQGTVTTTEEDSVQPVNVLTNRYAVAGTTITTGAGSVVKIGALSSGKTVLVGPRTTVRLTGNGFDIVEQPASPSWTVKHRPAKDYRVRTCTAVLSARG